MLSTYFKVLLERNIIMNADSCKTLLKLVFGNVKKIEKVQRRK